MLEFGLVMGLGLGGSGPGSNKPGGTGLVAQVLGTRGLSGLGPEALGRLLGLKPWDLTNLVLGGPGHLVPWCLGASRGT